MFYIYKDESELNLGEPATASGGLDPLYMGHRTTELCSGPKCSNCYICFVFYFFVSKIFCFFPIYSISLFYSACRTRQEMFGQRSIYHLPVLPFLLTSTDQLNKPSDEAFQLFSPIFPANKPSGVQWYGIIVAAFFISKLNILYWI